MGYALVFVIVFLVVAGLLALLLYSIGTAIKRQANKPVNRFFAPIPTAGTFVFRVLEGKVLNVIENVVGWVPDDQGRFVLDQRKDKRKSFGFLAGQLGVIWLGIYATLKVFAKWHWPEFKQVKKKDKEGKEIVKYEVEAREEDVKEFYFQFPYSILIEEIELEGNIQANINAVFTVFFLYPVRALITNKDFVDLFIAMVRSAVRAWMCDKDFNEIKRISLSSNKSADAVPGFWDMIDHLNGLQFNEEISPGVLLNPNEPKGQPLYETEEPRGIYGKLGVTVVRIEFEQVEAVGEAIAALEAKQLAELRGDANITQAEKEARVTVIGAEADAMAMDKRREARKRWVDQTIVEPVKAAPGVARVLTSENVASKDSKVTTWLEGGGAVAAITPSHPLPEEKK